MKRKGVVQVKDPSQTTAGTLIRVSLVNMGKDADLLKGVAIVTPLLMVF